MRRMFDFLTNGHAVHVRYLESSHLWFAFCGMGKVAKLYIHAVIPLLKRGSPCPRSMSLADFYHTRFLRSVSRCFRFRERGVNVPRRSKVGVVLRRCGGFIYLWPTCVLNNGLSVDSFAEINDKIGLHFTNRNLRGYHSEAIYLIGAFDSSFRPSVETGSVLIHRVAFN